MAQVFLNASPADQAKALGQELVRLGALLQMHPEDRGKYIGDLPYNMLAAAATQTNDKFNSPAHIEEYTLHNKPREFARYEVRIATNHFRPS